MTPRTGNSILLCLCLITACATPPADDSRAGTTPTASEISIATVPIRIERAERRLETGRDIDVARAELASVLGEPALEPADRDRAMLAMSRVAELEGKEEDAIRSVERLLSAHADGRQWPLEAAAESQLRKLLTGTAALPRAVRERERWPVAPLAHALGRYFPENASHEVTVRILRYGGSSEASDRLGTFNVGGALGDERRAACPLCEDQRPTHTISSRGSWTSIPKTVETGTESLEVFAFDLAEDRIPARYDARLPMPSAEVVARLERNEGVIAVKRRGDSPPVILIGAPRWAQLAEVEDALSRMSELPDLPVTVKVTPELCPEEIQAIVRASFGRFRVCYEELQVRQPTAAGTVAVDFAIEPDGTVGAPVIGDGSTLRDGAMDACMVSAFRALQFVKHPGRTTVTYPVAFSP